MTDYVLSIDPGISTGIALLSYDDETPAQLVQGWQFGGGLAGLIRWFADNTEDSPFHVGWTLPEVGDVGFFYEEAPIVIAEKFTARATKGFSYTTASLEPLRAEGALIALGLIPDYTVAEKRWRDPSLQYFSGGAGKAERKKKQHAFLKANDFYRTGKDFGTADADDFRSATAHGVNYIARELKHRPTFELIANWQVAF